MDEKSGAPEATSDNIQNEEKPESLESVNQEPSLNLVGDSKNIDIPTAQSDDNINKITCGNTVDNNLHLKHNEVIHNSNHTLEFEKEPKDVTHDGDKHDQNAEVNEDIITCDGNVSDLDANDNNTSAGEPINANESPCLKDVGGGGQENSKDNMGVFNDICDKLETNVPMEIGESSTDIINNIQNKPDTEIQCNFEKATGNANSIDIVDCVKENVSKDIAQDTTKIIEKASSNDTDMISDIQNQDVGVEIETKHVEVNNSTEIVEEKGMQTIEVAQEKSMEIAEGKKTEEQSIEIVKNEKTEEKITQTEEEKSVDIAENNSTEKVKSSTAGEEEKLQVEKDTSLENEIESKNETSEMETENMSIDKIAEKDVVDAEDKNDDCDVSPDFECSDIKEHVPSDDKIDSNDKASNEEAAVTEEDPFDQVVNEAMDIDESQTKESPMSKGLDSFECREVNISQSKDLEKTYDKMEQDNSVEELSEKGMNDDSAIEEAEEIQDFEASKGADEEICLLPDTEREISEADKERAILAKEILAKEAANKEAQEASSAFDTLFDGENEKSTSPGKDTDGISTIDKISSENISQDIEAKDETHSDDISLKESDDKDTESIDNTETELDIQEPLKENIIQEMPSLLQTCTLCSKEKQCNFQMLVEGIVKYLCQKDCVLNYKTENEQYTINMKKVIIKEIIGCEKTCEQCCNVKTCQYEIVKESTFLCNDDCVKEYKLQTFAKFIFKYKKVIIQEIMPSEHTCSVCNICKDVSYQYNVNNEDKYICSETCLTKLQEEFPDKYCVKVRKLFRVKEMPRLLNATTKIATESPKIIARTEEAAELAKLDREKSFTRNCRMCNEIVNGDEKNLTWETMDFCNEDCLSKYQNVTHSNCTNCKTRVQTASLGKYCVRFGFDVRQFCSSGCLEEFKKGLKVCSYCQKDISGGFEGFLAPVGDKGQFKDFCSQACMEKFDQMSKNAPAPNVVSQCAVCSKDKIVKVDVVIDGNDHKMCSTPCFSAFKFVNKVFPDQCDMCKKYYERKSSEHYTIYDESGPSMFCSKTCMNVFILSNRQIVPCSWCKVKKYNFDMIQRNFKGGQTVMMCSINCLTLYQVSVNAVSMRRIKCDHCKSLSQAQYHLTMSDATIRNFCTYQCVMAFQGQYAKSPITLGAEHKAQSATALKGAPVPTGVPKRTYNATRQAKAGGKSSVANKSFDTPIISNVQSLAPPINVHHTRGSTKTNQKTHQSTSQTAPSTTAPPPPLPPKPQFTTQLIVKPPCPKLVANMSTMCKPITMSKSTSCRQQMAAKECQTDDSLQKRILIPIPVPIYVPTPLNMYSLPYPVPVPIPLPIPVPVFIPTTRNSANGIMKEIKKIHEKMPTDPFEAELLMMAEMVAGDKKRNESDSESEEEPADDDGFSPEGMETSNTFGEDMLQMALKMATEYDEPAVDLESAMTANTITPSSHPPMTNEEGVDDPNPMHHHHMLMMEQQRAALRGRKRPNRPQNNSLGGGANKRNRRVSNTDGLPMMQPPAQPEPPREPTEKPDANMCLKYTFGVNAWKQWVMTKNADLEKSSIRRKPFKSEILQLTADELNYSLCLFVKEVRKPNGSEYAPDTIYYLVLGIQQYLFENGRIDNIFTDAYYEKFTECLDEVAKKFSVLYNDSQYIVTRVEEEHLWESKQLGAHSPHVLLSTLMFFNTKHFNLVTVEEHMQLSFSHIMKHWKRNPNQPGATKVPGSRNVLLRFYPPQAALEANSRKKKVYEQQENEENPLRCPVKLYEFYLSKCPESVKTRNDVFYLLPERSCVPDSPVWYSTMALGKEPLQKMLHRVKMVKEINIALLTS